MDCDLDLFQQKIIDSLDELRSLYPHINRLLLAYSGGLDSEVLLQWITKQSFVQQHYALQAVHVNHGVNQKAIEWEQHCKEHCEKCCIPLTIVRVNVKPVEKQSLEETLRLARYRVFNEMLDDNTALLTAHHQDDQAETVLFRLMRGSGPKGLAAMTKIRPLQNGILARPLLEVARHEIECFATQHALTWIEDDSNLNPRFDRNFIRHQVMPLLKQRWPGVTTALSRTALLCLQNETMLQQLLQQDFETVRMSACDHLNVVAINRFEKQKQGSLLRYWIELNGYSLPSQAQLDQLIQLLSSRHDSNPMVQWNQTMVRRFNDELIIAPLLQPINKTVKLEWDLQHPLELPFSLGTLEAVLQKGGGVHLPKDATLTVQFRQGGERCHPKGRSGSHPLKKCFQEWHVPPWLRDRVPLIYYQQQMIAVVGYSVCEPFAAKEGDIGLQFVIST